MTETAANILVAVVQFAPTDDRMHNRDRIAAFVAVAAARGARLIVFPEYSSYFVHPLGEGFVHNAESVDGDFVDTLRGAAREHDVYVVAGLVEETDVPRRFSNTLVAVDPLGDVVATYRKQHLYDAFGARESDWVVPGELGRPQIFHVDTIPVGLQTCYDIRFPEVSRTVVDAGAELIVVPAEWVRGPLKEHHWQTLVTARAIENTVYIAAADHTPPIGVGTSLIVDPMGVALAALGETTGVAVAEVSRARVAEVRESNPSLALRRYRVEPID
ncbi:carbon-nitrogen hydrolase family protein [Leifsonia poae]|uniref:carbon-nitrogen hydrolase family protein n=1 Tax=Leifsonia poae TaxID=110933 RepID=UPI003D66D941